MSSTSDNSFAAAENAAHLVSIDSDDSFSQIVAQSTQPEAQTPPRKLRRPGGCQGRGSCRVLGSLNCQDLYQDLTDHEHETVDGEPLFHSDDEVDHEDYEGYMGNYGRAPLREKIALSGGLESAAASRTRRGTTLAPGTRSPSGSTPP